LDILWLYDYQIIQHVYDKLPNRIFVAFINWTTVRFWFKWTMNYCSYVALLLFPQFPSCGLDASTTTRSGQTNHRSFGWHVHHFLIQTNNVLQHVHNRPVSTHIPLMEVVTIITQIKLWRGWMLVPKRVHRRTQVTHWTRWNEKSSKQGTCACAPSSVFGSA